MLLGLRSSLSLALLLPLGVLGCTLTQGLNDILCSKDDPHCASERENNGTGGAGGQTSGSDSVGGTAATGGSDGSDGTGGSNADLNCPDKGELTLLYLNGAPQDESGASDRIRPYFQITNTSDDDIPLFGLSIRYYFTADEAEDLTYECVSAFGFNGDPCRDYLKDQITTTDGQSFVEISFTQDAIPLRAHSTSHAIKGYITHLNGPDFNQLNDYSYSEASEHLEEVDGRYAAWQKVTLHCGELLLDGSPAL